MIKQYFYIICYSDDTAVLNTLEKNGIEILKISEFMTSHPRTMLLIKCEPSTENLKVLMELAENNLAHTYNENVDFQMKCDREEDLK